MFKLMKYEFRKWRTTLLALGGGLVALEAGFIFGQMTNRNSTMIVCLSLLGFLAFASFIYITIVGIASYSRELKDRSGYLTFMTPVRPLGIVLSKLFFIALVALVAMALFGTAAWLDFRHLIGQLNLDAHTVDQLNLMLRFGLKTNATIQQIAQTVGFALLTGLLEILMTMCTAYLAITLSATLLQNKKGFVRGLISLVLFCALSWGAGWLTQRLLNGSVSFDSVESITSGQLTRAFGLSALLNFGFCAVFTVVSAWLLDHKIDL